MPRGEARIRVTIWDDPDYTALPMDAQWFYEALLSQKALNHAGVQIIPRREWSNLCADDDAADRIARARKVLEERRYIVVDDDTDELLVRSYIRRDVESAPPGTFRSAMNSAVAVSSARLRDVLHSELLRLDADVIAAKGTANGERPIDALQRALSALGGGPDGPRGQSETTFEHGMDIEGASDAHGTDSHGMDNASGVHVGRRRRRRKGSAPVGEQVGGSRAPARATTSPASPRDDNNFDEQLCGRRHDPGPDCRECGRARRDSAGRAESQSRDAAAERAARRAAAEDCSWCATTGGWIENPRTRDPLARCDHQTDPRFVIARALGETA